MTSESNDDAALTCLVETEISFIIGYSHGLLMRVLHDEVQHRQGTQSIRLPLVVNQHPTGSNGHPKLIIAISF